MVGEVFVVLLGRLLAALLHELGEVALLLELLELVQKLQAPHLGCGW